MDNAIFKRSIPELLAGARVLFSKGSWLLMENIGADSLCSFNPSTGEINCYPDISFQGIGFSNLPSSSDCITTAINWFPPSVAIYYMRQEEQVWHGVYVCSESEFKPFSNPVFINGALYFLGLSGNLAEFTVDDRRWDLLEEPEKPCRSDHHRYLAECGGELFSIFVGFEGQWVEIFRLNRAKPVWLKVESLGSYMLFVSDSSSYSAVARTPGMENKIYFTRYHGQKKSLVFYSLASRNFHCLGSRDASMENFCGTMEPRNCCWIEPK